MQISKLWQTLFATSRPPFLLLTPCCLSIAVSFAVAQRIPINGFHLLLIISIALTAHASANMLNEYYDFNSGLDLHTQRTPFSGGSGTLPHSPEYAPAVLKSGLLLLLITLIIGLYLLFNSGSLLIPIVGSGIALVYFYTPKITRSPFLCLIATGFAFGILMINGAYYVLTKQLNNTVFAISIIPFFLVNNLLLLNQLPDVEADRDAGRCHLAIMLGKHHAVKTYISFLIITYSLLGLYIILELLPFYSLLALLTILLAVPAAKISLQYFDDNEKLKPALALNVALVLLTPILISAGLIWQSFL